LPFLRLVSLLLGSLLLVALFLGFLLLPFLLLVYHDPVNPDFVTTEQHTGDKWHSKVNNGW
jgi:hypothetical protein